MLHHQIGLSLRKWTYSFAEIMMFFPIILTIMHFFIVPEHRLFLLISFFLIYFMVIMLHDLVEIQSTMAHLLLAGAAGAIAIFASDSLISGLLTGILIAYFWMRGMLVARFAPGRLYPDAHFWIGIWVYVLAYLPFRYYHPLKEEMYFLYTVSGSVFLVIALLIFNGLRLENQSLAKGNINNKYPALLRLNRIYIACFLLLVSGLTYLASRIGHSKGITFNMRMAIPIPNVPIGGVGGVSNEMDEHSGSKTGDHLLGKIILYILGAVAVYYVIRILIRLLPLLKILAIQVFKWLRRFLKELKGNTVQKGKGYVDEYSKIGLFEKSKKKSKEDGLLARIARFLAREPKWEQLPNNREKIRYLYRHWMFDFMRKGYVFKRSLTPKETLVDLRVNDHEDEQSGPQLTALYERVRYGGDIVSVSDEEAELMRETMSKTNKQ